MFEHTDLIAVKNDPGSAANRKGCGPIPVTTAMSERSGAGEEGRGGCELATEAIGILQSGRREA
jgi:hypothetical protein